MPPPYTLVALRESKDAFAHACRIAADAGAGTFVCVRRFDLVEFAVVLEPEEPLASARRAFLAGMVALADAIGSHCAPEKSVTFEWPDAIRYDGARLGGGRLGWPECPQESVPEWLVFSAMLIASKHWAGDPGLTPSSTSLDEEGFEGRDRDAIVESFARHLMLGFDTWANQGFGEVAERYLARLPGRPNALRSEIARNGDLLIHHDGRQGGIERVPLLGALASPSWLDATTGAPRL